MATALLPLQGAILAALKAHAPLMAKVTGVYDVPPSTAVLPYVSVGSITEQPTDAHNQRGIDTAFVLHIWSDYQGNAQAGQILASLTDVLDRQPLTVTGWPHVSIALDQAYTVEDPDPRIRHINARFRVWLSQ